MNFDVTIDRRNTDCLKYDFAVERRRPADVLPLWVADMDFPVPEAVSEALAARARHGIFGYTDVKRDYFEAVADWFKAHHGWTPEEDWLVKTPGVVFALAMAIKACTVEGDAVLIQPPVYYPFFEVVRDNNRHLVENELVLRDGRYEIDFDKLEAQFRDEQVKLMILCSPHNPVGRVWTREELEKVAALCVKYGVVLAADEIHCDFTRPGHPFTSAATLAGDIRNQVIICTAPSKTFNLAGLQVSNIFIPDKKLRDAFRHQIDAAGYSQLNAMGLLACKVAYREGADWLTEVKAYIEGNLTYLREYLKQNLPQIKLIEPEGTYLVWLDCGAIGLTGSALNRFITEKARLWLDGGNMFGGDAGQFQRINLACSRATLGQALEQLRQAVENA
ncbi:MAG: pyridoxal phosphate-dependent aminotransferase [Clostridia bacterium]|nr:pyridoxal phosphate-dependent aminotransferase [Clostridia bacterium]